MIDYPNKLNIIFDKLKKFHIKPIIIGGYVRDKLLKLDSKDIDIELYGVSSLKKLENILEEFGKINSVGKSFGVCKLQFENLDIDFSLPREDSKISSGHKGFKISTKDTLNFKTATSRRDFTMNAIGYDVIERKLLDPFSGQKDIKNKIIRAVDLNKFSEDPLRVLRAIQFSARFDFLLDYELFLECKSMVRNNLLKELAKERIFDEIKKLLLKSKKPSIGLSLLNKLNIFTFSKNILKSVDKLASLGIKNKKLTVVLSILCSEFSKKNRTFFLNTLTNEKKIHTDINDFLEQLNIFNLDDFNDYQIYKLATNVNIESYSHLLNSLEKKPAKARSYLEKRAKELGVFNARLQPLIQGRDIIKLGRKPSKEFSNILDMAYDEQMKGTFSTRGDAHTWLKKLIG